MEKTGTIEILIRGKRGNHPLRPDTYDIRELIEFLHHAENLLFPNAKKERPTISYEISEGSVKHIIKTTIQAILGFNAILSEIQTTGYSIDFLEAPTARAFEFFQSEAQKHNYSYEITTSVSAEFRMNIDKTTRFVRSEEIWAEAEFYLYGVIVNAGGKNKANIHLETRDMGLITIETNKALLAAHEPNPLYKSYGLRARGKQNVKTGEIDRTSLQLIEIIDYSNKPKDDYLQSLIQKAQKSWAEVGDADEWLQTVRAYEG